MYMQYFHMCTPCVYNTCIYTSKNNICVRVYTCIYNRALPKKLSKYTCMCGLMPIGLWC